MVWCEIAGDKRVPSDGVETEYKYHIEHLPVVSTSKFRLGHRLYGKLHHGTKQFAMSCAPTCWRLLPSKTSIYRYHLSIRVPTIAANTTQQMDVAQKLRGPRYVACALPWQCWNGLWGVRLLSNNQPSPIGPYVSNVFWRTSNQLWLKMCQQESPI